MAYERELIHALVHRENKGQPASVLNKTIADHYFYYQEIPQWGRVITQLLQRGCYGSAHIAIEHIDDDDLRAWWRIEYVTHCRSLGLRTTPRPA